ncbi:MAG: HAMP domain-containing sensor histidine kinase [Acidimicrobiales bacterium]
MSLRARLLIGTAVIAIVLGVAAVAIARTTRGHLVDQIDGQLRSATQIVIGRGAGGPGGEDGPARLSTLYVGVLSAEGGLFTRSAPDLVGDVAPEPIVSDGAARNLRAGATVTVASDDPDVDYRMQARIERRTGATVVLALPLDGVDEAVRRLIAVEAAAVLVVLAVLALVTWWVIRLGVRPVQRMTVTAGAIAAGDLSQRVPEGAAGTEAGDLGVALNGMLGRIEEAFDQRSASEARLRQFVADASHELRTPVATIRGYAELYRTGALDQPAELADAMRRTEQEAVRMGTLVDDLLHLARLDQGRPLDRSPVDLRPLIDDAARDARAVDPGCDVRGMADGPIMVIGDRARLHQVIANLVSNALVHAPGAAIEVRARDADGVAVLEVADDGPGMSATDAARAFERFYRSDVSRSRHHGGSGLGLAIVDATVRAHGGTTSIVTEPGGGTTVEVRLPVAPASIVTS